MSTLSWIIYLADIVTGLVNILIIGGAIILIATAVLLGIWSEDIDFYKHKKTYLLYKNQR